MKQLVLHLADSVPAVEEVPVPSASPGTLLIHVKASLVSTGTERSMVHFAEKSILEKAKSRPDLVEQTLQKARRDGVLQTLNAVKNRLSGILPLGYSNAGVIISVGQGVAGFAVGDRVSCAGEGANHAEVVKVSCNLAVKLPESISFEEAAFSTLGAIALQGFRLANVKLGEKVAVIGLGLLGQITVQLLRAAGCTVVGFDFIEDRARLSEKFGAESAATSSEEFNAECSNFTAGRGVDAVLITADTTSNDPVSLAGQVVRDKGVVVAVGAVGTSLPRRPYFEKELEFRISRSYGPGRYDRSYEEGGHDYPYAYVRWTEQRNMEAVVNLIAQGKLDMTSLTSHQIAIENALLAYEIITQKTEPFLGVLLTYPNEIDVTHRLELKKPAIVVTQNQRKPFDEVRLAVLGAGNYAKATFLPALQKTSNVVLHSITSSSGLSAKWSAQHFNFAQCCTNEKEAIHDENVNTIAILTRHHLHAGQAIASLDAGKNVFVEKPLCLTDAELKSINTAYAKAQTRGEPCSLVVGFNRRFAPFVRTLRHALDEVNEPKLVTCRVNAGFLPKDHWIQDENIGGGRLLGDACHHIDLSIHLVGAIPSRVTAVALHNNGKYQQDNFLLTIQFADGSLASIQYLANGNTAFGKELIEVSGGGLSARIDDYRKLEIHAHGKSIKRSARLRPDKGHADFFRAFACHLTDGSPPPISFREVVLSTAVTLAAEKSLRLREPVDVDLST